MFWDDKYGTQGLSSEVSNLHSTSCHTSCFIKHKETGMQSKSILAVHVLHELQSQISYICEVAGSQVVHKVKLY